GISPANHRHSHDHVPDRLSRAAEGCSDLHLRSHAERQNRLCGLPRGGELLPSGDGPRWKLHSGHWRGISRRSGRGVLMRVFHCMTGEGIAQCWEDFLPFFEAFEKGGSDLSVDEAYRKAKAAHLQVWGLQDDTEIRGIVTTEVIHTAHGLVCVITMAQGSAPEESKHALMEDIVRWAREMGCRRVRLQGRPGWMRWDRR